MRRVSDRRYVIDRGVVTTTGVSASIPVSLALVEAIAGSGRATALAATLGVAVWDARHDHYACRLDRWHVAAATANRLAFWRHETLRATVAAGFDEIALALAADAWSRTWRSRVILHTRDRRSVASVSGLRLHPDVPGQGRAPDFNLPTAADSRPTLALDAALSLISDRYGANTARFVAPQLEYRRPTTAPNAP